MLFGIFQFALPLGKTTKKPDKTMKKSELDKQLAKGVISQEQYDIKLKKLQASEFTEEQRGDLVNFKANAIEVTGDRHLVALAKKAVANIRKDNGATKGEVLDVEANLERVLKEQGVRLTELGEMQLEQLASVGAIKQASSLIRHGKDVYLTEEQQLKVKELQELWDDFVLANPKAAELICSRAMEHGDCDALSMRFSVKGAERRTSVTSTWSADNSVMAEPLFEAKQMFEAFVTKRDIEAKPDETKPEPEPVTA